MDKHAGQDDAVEKLFPPIEPFDRRVMDVGDGHQVYMEQCGNPTGLPVIIMHGGPGGGCSPAMRRFFDPKIYRIVLFDQRGCGRSRPHASVEDNTTWHLVRDIEQIRTALGIESWIVFGGSWGATLSLIYAQSHPDRVTHLVLRGVFLATERELDWFYGGGAGRFFPDVWARFESLIPENERTDLIKAYHKRLFSKDRTAQLLYARAWTEWENALAAIESNGQVGSVPSDHAMAFARLENHYFTNGAFLSEDQQILSNIDKIAHIPCHIVQGRFDMVCPPESAASLAAKWPKARLEIVPMSGHAMSEPRITQSLLRIMRNIALQG